MVQCTQVLGCRCSCVGILVNFTGAGEVRFDMDMTSAAFATGLTVEHRFLRSAATVPFPGGVTAPEAPLPSILVATPFARPGQPSGGGAS